MNPVPFKQQNVIYTKPANMTEEECGSLPAQRFLYNGKYAASNVVFELSDEELA